jgi:nucleoid DNA-binding protein
MGHAKVTNFQALWEQTGAVHGKLLSAIRKSVDLFISLFITMEITQAIRRLLFLEDCLIIPGLGGFVSSYHPAMIDQSTGTFFPPVKEVVFNPELVQNDGLLVRYLAHEKGISADSARLMIDGFVTRVRIELEKGEPFALENLGQFLLDRDRVIRFQADPGTNLSLGSFGLPALQVRELAPAAQIAAPVVLSPIEEVTSAIIEFDIERSGRRLFNHNLRRIAIAMPLLIAFSLLPYNSRIAETFSPSPAAILPEPSLLRLEYPAEKNQDSSSLVVYPSAAPEVILPEAEAAPAPEIVPAGRYQVIAGCFRVRENAEKLHEQLIAKGYPASIKSSSNGFHKVSIQSFTSRQEAITGLAKFRKAEASYDFWLSE